MKTPFNKSRNDEWGWVFGMLEGRIALTDQHFIGPTCLVNHGSDGRTVRYRRTGHCVICAKQAATAREVHKNRRLDALRKHEERMEREADYDPLFD